MGLFRLTVFISSPNPEEISFFKPSQTRKSYLFHPLTNLLTITAQG